MGRMLRTALAVISLSASLVACGGGGAAAPQRLTDQAPPTAPSPSTAQVPDPAPQTGADATSAQPAAPPESSKPAAAPEPAPESKSAPPAAKTGVEDPGGPVGVAPALAGATPIGADKCRMCHKIQYDSWSGSAHAKRNPPLDCEACHGPGSEYKTMAVMKDPAKARAAGLVIPDKAFCAACHKSGWTDTMLAAAHAHKPK